MMIWEMLLLGGMPIKAIGANIADSIGLWSTQIFRQLVPFIKLTIPEIYVELIQIVNFWMIKKGGKMFFPQRHGGRALNCAPRNL